MWKSKRDRIRLLDTGEPRRDVRRHDGERADGAVDVKPQFFAGRDGGERRQVVDGAGIDRAGSADHQEGCQTCVAVPRDGRVERRKIYLMKIVGGNDMQCRIAEAGQIHGLRNAAVRGRRGIGDETFAGRCDAVAAHLDAQFARARDQHAEQIGHRRTGDEQPACRAGKFEQLTQPVHDLPLNFDRHVVAAAEIGVEAGGEHLRQHAGHAAAAMHPAHEAGVHIAGGERENVAHEFVVHGGKTGRSARDVRLEAGAHAVRNRFPHRALADVLDVIENIVEHPVPLGTGALPIHRVETAAGIGEWVGYHRTGKVSLIY